MESAEVVTITKDYYDSNDADNFYFHVWGGEDIHIGLYESADEDIASASKRTVVQMCAGLPIDQDTRILDIGSGYGGSARYLARSYGCHVTCLNLSQVQNDRNIELNQQQGLSHLIEVVTGSFEDLPFPDAGFNLVWSQDAILHSGNRQKVLREVARMLGAGGHFIFTDPMQSDTADPAQLKPVLERIHLASMGSPGFYRQAAAKVGLEFISFQDHSHQLINHYSQVDRMLAVRQTELEQVCSPAYLQRMRKGLAHWVAAGKQGALQWGIMQMRKPA